MVTQSAPVESKPKAEYPGRENGSVRPKPRAAGSDLVLERELLAPQEAPGEVAVPRLTKRGVARIAARLLSVYDWLAGPPLTQRDRRVREIEEYNRMREGDPRFFSY
jgi:hypothetical protein